MDLIIQEPCEYHSPVKNNNNNKKTSSGNKSEQVTNNKRTKLNAKSKEKKENEKNVVVNNADFWEKQKQAFDEQWNKINAKLMKHSSSFFCEYTDKVYQFIVRHTQQSPVLLRDGQLVGFNFGALPTAMLALNSKLTQVRIADEISEIVAEDDTTTTTVKLDSSQSGNMGELCQALFGSLLIHNEKIESDELKKSKSKMSFDEGFQLWLDHQQQSITSTKKTKSNNNKSTSVSLVIFILDFENFNKQTLTNFVLILKEYLHKLSLVLVLMILNTLNSSIQCFLPAHATDHLMIEDITPFYEPKFIPQVLQEFVIDPKIEFKLHPKLLKQLYIYLTTYEMSFANFVQLLRGMAWDHFYHDSLSIVCQRKHFQNILNTDDQLLQTFKHQLPATILSQQSKNDDEYIDAVQAEYTSLIDRNYQFSFAIEVIIDLRTYCHIETKCFIELYCQLAIEPDYESFLSSLLQVKENTWNAALNKLLSKYRPERNNELINSLITYHNQLIDLLQKEQEEEQKQLNTTKKLGLECEVKIMKDKLRNMQSRTEWRHNLAPNMAQTRLKCPFEQWKTLLVDLLEKYLTQFSFTKCANMMDLLFYKKTTFLHEHHLGSVREKIDHTLDMRSMNMRVEHHYPNSYILYQLYKDASPVINLHSWYEKYCEEKKQEKASNNTNNGSISEKELLVHFASTLSDLDYIGLLQASKYKADYMNKLVWF